MLLNPILTPSVHDTGQATASFSLLPGVFASIVDKDKCDKDSCYSLSSICDPCVLTFFFTHVYNSGPTDMALTLVGGGCHTCCKPPQSSLKKQLSYSCLFLMLGTVIYPPPTSAVLLGCDCYSRLLSLGMKAFPFMLWG